MVYTVAVFILAVWFPIAAYYFIPSDDDGYFK